MKVGSSIVRGTAVACLVLGVILSSAGAMLLTARDAYGQSVTVSTIIVQGNQRVEADTIRSYFRPGPGGRLDAFQIDEGVKALYATGLFQDIRPSIQGGRLILVVIENPVINRIAFEGNKKVKDEQLKSEIQSKERGTLSRPIVQADVARLVEVYRRSGRFDVRIEPKIIELPNNRVRALGGEDVFRAALTPICVAHGTRKAIAIPEPFRTALERYRAACLEADAGGWTKTDPY